MKGENPEKGADVPSCIGVPRRPISANGPCPECPFKEVCRHTVEHFVPKEVIATFVEKIEAILTD